MQHVATIKVLSLVKLDHSVTVTYNKVQILPLCVLSWWIFFVIIIVLGNSLLNIVIRPYTSMHHTMSPLKGIFPTTIAGSIEQIAVWDTKWGEDDEKLMGLGLPSIVMYTG